ncbi:hypothetical protein EDB85DRAFT_332933 [Lactarius pseudohatsudake]|nr:hypothetical protein EDB85DRAFT_332933 [Lactarius pseudohatsudake]
MFPSPGAYCSEVLQGRVCHVSVSDVLATAFLLWFTWFTRSNLLPTARPAQLLGHIRDSHKSQTIKRSRAPSPASLYLPRPCPHPPTLSTRPQCLPFPSLPTKGQISRAPVSTSSHHDAPTVVTVMESTRKTAFSVEPLYHYPCSPQEVVAEEDGGVCGAYDRGSASLYLIDQETCFSFERCMILFLLAPCLGVEAR